MFPVDEALRNRPEIKKKILLAALQQRCPCLGVPRGQRPRRPGLRQDAREEHRGRGAFHRRGAEKSQQRLGAPGRRKEASLPLPLLLSNAALVIILIRLVRAPDAAVPAQTACVNLEGSRAASPYTAGCARPSTMPTSTAIVEQRRRRDRPVDRSLFSLLPSPPRSRPRWGQRPPAPRKRRGLPRPWRGERPLVRQQQQHAHEEQGNG